MKQLDRFNKVLKEVYDYFGFVEDWKVFPLEDGREYWWEIVGDEVFMYDNFEAYKNQDDSKSYAVYILQHRFYNQSIWKGKDYTMILVDTHCDGNQFLEIFDNKKRINTPLKNKSTNL